MTEQTETQGNEFRLWFPASIAKSASTKSGQRIVQGIASTEDIDAQGESVLQQGIDLTPLLKDGFINADHKTGFDNIIGEPIEAKITHAEGGKPVMFLKALIYEGVPQADAAWNLLNSLEKGRADGATNRRLGWSVEGAVLERRGNLIAKSVVRHVALTHQPVAYGTFAALAKSMVKAQSVAASSTATDAPLLLQNLQGGKSAQQVCVALFGKNSSKCSDIHKGFRKSRTDFVDHLVLCQGWPTDAARSFVSTLSGLLG